jgi:hypothetical protein
MLILPSITYPVLCIKIHLLYKTNAQADIFLMLLISHAKSLISAGRWLSVHLNTYIGQAFLKHCQVSYL